MRQLHSKQQNKQCVIPSEQIITQWKPLACEMLCCPLLLAQLRYSCTHISSSPFRTVYVEPTWFGSNTWAPVAAIIIFCSTSNTALPSPLVYFNGEIYQHPGDSQFYVPRSMVHIPRSVTLVYIPHSNYWFVFHIVHLTSWHCNHIGVMFLQITRAINVLSSSVREKNHVYWLKLCCS